MLGQISLMQVVVPKKVCGCSMSYLSLLLTVASLENLALNTLWNKWERCADRSGFCAQVITHELADCVDFVRNYLRALAFSMCIYAGYANPNNSRVRSTEARIRKGEKSVAPRIQGNKKVASAKSYARAYLRNYVFKTSQASPSDTILYVEHVGSRQLFMDYAKETLHQLKKLGKPAFLKQWQYVLQNGVTDPETSTSYKVVILQSRAKGFAMCNDCKYFQMRMRATRDWTKRAEYQRRLRSHLDLVRDDREELARIMRLCITNPRHVGFFLDAANSAKFQVPTTQSTAKLMSQLWRIRQKLTCVQMFDLKKTLYIFRTLPNVPTGGNLTCTILTYMFNTLASCEFQQATDLHINIDGAGDNVCYTLQYFIVHVLICAYENKWKLRRIHLLRMRVGHTHNDLDATFALLSRLVYGKHSRGDSRKDILSFEAFDEVR